MGNQKAINGPSTGYVYIVAIFDIFCVHVIHTCIYICMCMYVYQRLYIYIHNMYIYIYSMYMGTLIEVLCLFRVLVVFTEGPKLAPQAPSVTKITEMLCVV